VLNNLITSLENFFFKYRALTLGLIAILTAVMAYFALQLRMDAGFEKQMPVGHEYIKTFQQYKSDLFGANRLTVVVKARQGTVWTQDGLRKLFEVTQAVQNLPNIEKLGVKSLWTSNTFVNEITEEGFRADPLIDGTITPDSLNDEVIGKIQAAAIQGDFIGTLVARDQSSAMITADIIEINSDGTKLDYIDYNHKLEAELRQKFEDNKYEIQIIGFAKQIGDIADGASSVIVFFTIALLLTAGAVYWYCQSVRFTLLPLVCSLTSLVWQFGTLYLLGYGLDPLAILVPFLVFAIGVSHGVQQINFIVREISVGNSTEAAARSSFAGLLIPGTLALVTAFVSFISLTLIPIPMVRELAITASIGVAYKIITNLIMLPVAASCFKFSRVYAQEAMVTRERRAEWLSFLSKLSTFKNSVITLLVVACVFGISVWQSSDRVIGTLQAGAPELQADARFNKDAVSISKSYDVGLDWLSVVFETKPDTCENVQMGLYQDRFVASVKHTPGVVSISSFSTQMKTYSEGYNEGNPKMSVIPIDGGNFAGLGAEIARNPGFVKKDCSMTAAHLFLADHKAVTISGVIKAVEDFQRSNPDADIKIRLAAGNAGVLAAINDEIERSELPMMLYVYLAIIILVFLVYRDFRAMIACCVPLTVGTFIGYWFMKELEIGLTVATLPVMVLAVGIGVDYAFYIYNRLQLHLANGDKIQKALEKSIQEVGMATIFTAITLAIGVATWSFSPLKFQADMGKLLAFMFMINLIMAMTALPALAVVLEKVFPRRVPIKAPGLFSH